MCEHHHHHHHNKNRQLPLRLALGLVLLICASAIPEVKIKIILFIIAYLVSGCEVLINAIQNIKKGEIFDENFLMVTATIGAFAIQEYPEGVMVILLYQIGEYLQDRAVEKSKKSISELMNIRPDFANVKRGEDFIKEKPENVAINDIILVKTGEKIPLDGIVLDGHAVVDTSAITGESVPKNLKTKDTAVSGCINVNGILKIQVTKEYKESTVAKILELVEHAGNKKTQTERFITKFAKIYTPIVVLSAILISLIPPIITGTSFSIWFTRALTFLVISCPCALVISVPLSFFAGIGCASKQGILIKGSKYLEKLTNPKIIAFDKTGTLTCGTFTVRNICPQEEFTKEELLNTAASAEYYSNHPIAISIKDYYNLTPDVPEDTEEIAGKGVISKINKDVILVGNKELMSDFGITITETQVIGTIVYIAKNNKYTGCISIADALKPDTASAITQLKRLNIQTAILTGDNKENAEQTQNLLKTDKIYAELLPQDKVNIIQKLIEAPPKNKSVIFVGDGINDAPVLTTADIGISMGGLGADAAIEASDIVIMDDNLKKIPTAIVIARKTINIARQNILLAIGIKVVFLGLGAIGFMTLWGAVFADVGVTLLAVLNSLRCLKVKPIES